MILRTCAYALFPLAMLRAVPPTYTTPHWDDTPFGQETSVWFGGLKYVNKGLVGVGQLTVGGLDYRGDSLGSFSSFKFSPGSWRRKADGTYVGTLITLPDRGYNARGLIDYPARTQQFEVAFRPDYGRTPVSRPNLVLTFRSTRTVLDFQGNVTTGLDPHGDTLHGYTPVPARHGKFAVDAEGLALLPDGSFFFSEEYGPMVYHVAANGKMLGLVTPPTALLPRFSSQAYRGFTTEKKAVEEQTGGRRDNQGYEGLDVTPDGRHLVAMLQSAPRQDCPGEDDQNRAYTRVLVYALAGGVVSAKPVGHYLVELPTYDSAGNGRPPNKTAAQSELIALNSRTFLVLARDGNGNGSGKSGYAPTGAAVGYAEHPMVYKNVTLVSTVGATNLVGTPYETGYTPAVRGAGPTLAPAYGLTAAKCTDFVNLLNPSQLARFGLDLNVVGAAGVAKAATDGHRIGALSAASLSAKWEALALVPCLDRAYPDDYFLFVGNDNDFLTAEGIMLGRTYDGLATGPGEEVGENLNRILVYRVTLPGYISSER